MNYICFEMFVQIICEVHIFKMDVKKEQSILKTILDMSLHLISSLLDTKIIYS